MQVGRRSGLAPLLVVLEVVEDRVLLEEIRGALASMRPREQILNRATVRADRDVRSPPFFQLGYPCLTVAKDQLRRV